MKLNINMPASAIYMAHTAPSVEGSACVLVHFDRYGVPRSMMSGTFGESTFSDIPDETWISGDFTCHMVASHEPDHNKISRRTIKRIIKHWQRNADICNNAHNAGDLSVVVSWYGGFVPSPQNK